MDGAGFPSRYAVAATLAARGHEFLNFSYTPGNGSGATAEEIADTIEAAFRDIAQGGGRPIDLSV